MKSLIVSTAFAFVLTLGGLANAAQIASPSIFGNHFQEDAECVVLNSGTKPLAVTVKIINDLGDTVATSNCSGPLGAGEFCSVVRSIDFRNSFSCVATAPSTASLRGTLVLEQKVVDDFFLLQTHPIRFASLQ